MSCHRLLAGALALGLVGAVAAGCSSDPDAGPAVPTTLVPSSSGDSCTDPTGDLDLPVGVAADTAGLTGIDLVEAWAAVEGEQLVVTMTMAGPVDAAPAATYVVAQGDPLGALSFEVRMVRGADGWSTTLITWPDGVETRQRSTIVPTIDGATLTASVPLSSLPPIALAMQFGATAEVGGAIVVDDCTSLTSG